MVAFASMTLQTATSPTGPWTTLHVYVSAAGGTFNHTGLNASTTYYYRAQAAEAYGRSSTFSSTNATTATAPPPSSKIKWNPGYYLSSWQYTTLGNLNNSGQAAGPQKAADATLVHQGPSFVLGKEDYYFWRALWNSGTFDGSTAGGGFDQDYVNAVGYVSGTAGVGAGPVYNTPQKRWGIYLLHTDFFNPNPQARCVPDALLNDSNAGAGASGSLRGWWTCTGQTGSAGGSEFAWWRSYEMGKYIQFIQQMAAHVLPDGYTVANSPYIEWIKLLLETDDVPANSSGAINDPSYSDSGAIAQYEQLITAAVAAFPNTNVVIPFNFLQTASSAVSLAQYLPGARCATGGPDVFGASTGQNIPNGGGQAGYTWGQALHVGLLPPAGNAFTTPWVGGGTDYRLMIPEMATIQGTEFVTGNVSLYTPTDLLNQCNNLKATHVAFQNAPAGSTPTAALWLGRASSISQWLSAPGTWGGVLDAMYATALTNSAYPTSYP
jgi:hypothetical protein